MSAAGRGGRAGAGEASPSRRPSQTLRRLERVLTMVPWLLDHPGVTIDEAAERFGASRDELVEDLDILGYCGLPGYGGGDLIEASIVGDRISVRMADFFRRPLRLSLQEAITLLLAARALASAPGMPESAALDRAASKLSSALGGPAGAGPDLADARVDIDLSAPGDEHLPGLRAAVAEHRVVRLLYRAASTGATSQRDVEPAALIAWAGGWYLQGHCRLAGAERVFRLDRIRELEVTDERLPESRALAPARSPAYQPEGGDLEAVLDLSPQAWWVEEWAVLDSVEPRGEIHRVRLRAAEPDWVARLVLRLGQHVRVISPPDLTERVRRLAAATLHRYR
ncbi:MAG TPA: WYL domain-containing protein [Egibacteraceae bacterium]|nr:WYL domain-containing protein [Egibacteraceae bacterium]